MTSPPAPASPTVRARRRTVVGAALLLAACAADGGAHLPVLHPEIDDWPQTRVEIEVDGDEHEVAALVAATPERRQRGLQRVEHLPEGAGMLFLFDRDRDTGFWMKDTLVPLEIAFASADGEIVEVLSMAPCEEEPCEVHLPQATYRAALEVPDGWLSERGIGPGATVGWDEVAEVP